MFLSLSSTLRAMLLPGQSTQAAIIVDHRATRTRVRSHIITPACPLLPPESSSLMEILVAIKECPVFMAMCAYSVQRCIYRQFWKITFKRDFLRLDHIKHDNVFHSIRPLCSYQSTNHLLLLYDSIVFENTAAIYHLGETSKLHKRGRRSQSGRILVESFSASRTHTQTKFPVIVTLCCHS